MPPSRPVRPSPGPLPGQLHGVLEPIIAGAGFELDELDVRAAGRRHTVKVVVDSDTGVGLDDIAKLSRAAAAELDRHEQRLRELRRRVLVGELGGAVGSLASLGTQGIEVQRRLMDRLGLGVPVIAWHTARDGFAELVHLHDAGMMQAAAQPRFGDDRGARGVRQRVVAREHALDHDRAREAGGAVDDRVALGIDILPTIADHLGIETLWKLDGRSLLGTPRTEQTRKVLDWKFTSTGDGGYDKRLNEVLKGTKFRPGTTPQGVPIRMKAQIIYDF